MLATDAFDPTASPVRYRFGAPELVDGGRGPRSVYHEARDPDGDGREDLLQFPIDDAELGGAEVAELRWDSPFEVRPREGSAGWVAASNTPSRERVVGPDQPWQGRPTGPAEA